jgi:hypothetical protein
MCVMLMLKGSSQAWHATFLILQTYSDLFMGAVLRVARLPCECGWCWPYLVR